VSACVGVVVPYGVWRWWESVFQFGCSGELFCSFVFLICFYEFWVVFAVVGFAVFSV
jgi:hypothetical protein